MKIAEILKLPVVIDNIHESVYRVYHILEKVKEYLSMGYDKDIILNLIDEMEYKEKEI